jgi:hypothetical protein
MQIMILSMQFPHGRTSFLSSANKPFNILLVDIPRKYNFLLLRFNDEEATCRLHQCETVNWMIVTSVNGVSSEIEILASH